MNKDKETQQQTAEKQPEHKQQSPSKKSSQDKASYDAQQAQEEQQDAVAQLLEQVGQKDTEQTKRLMQVMLAQPKGGQYENRPSW
jgi:restriction endonuclease Mrr